MARTSKKTDEEVEERGSEARFTALFERSEPTAMPETAARNGALDSPPVFTHPAAPKETLIALARLLGRTAARDMMATAATTACAVEEPRHCDQVEVTR